MEQFTKFITRFERTIGIGRAEALNIGLMTFVNMMIAKNMGDAPDGNSSIWLNNVLFPFGFCLPLSNLGINIAREFPSIHGEGAPYRELLERSLFRLVPLAPYIPILIDMITTSK